MNAQPVLVDTNLLVLFIVGTASPSYIQRHKRLTEFDEEDYKLLVRLLSNASDVFVTPNTLTETSNLAGYISEPARSQVYRVLQKITNESTEIVIPSKSAVARTEFIRLGLTDAALIHATTENTVLLTADLSLYLAATAAGAIAMNFNHIRDN